MLTLFGQCINTIRPAVAEAVARRDTDFIQAEARSQADGGAHFIDINVGSAADVEPNFMAWAVQAVQVAVDIPLAIDSSNPSTIAAGLVACANPSRATANSATLETKRLEAVLSLTREHGCSVIGLPITDRGLPITAEETVERHLRLLEAAGRYGIPPERVHLDLAGQPISVDPGAAMRALAALSEVKRRAPEARIIVCLDAFSFGLPHRRLIHRALLPMLMAAGLDALLVDPTDVQLMATIAACDLVLSNDEDSTIDYLDAFRAGRL